MESVSVSIVIPVWNTFNYLRPCIKSILEQDYQDFEVILVDDGSTDGSSSLCDVLSAEDNRIKAIHQENCGAGAARKNGVAVSNGKWIMFVDSDDTVTKYGLTFLIKIASDYEIVSGGININGRLFAHKKDGIYDPADYIEALLLSDTTDGPCGKLIRRNLFYDIDWDVPKEISQNEDMLMLVSLASQAKDIYLTSDIICYNYLLREGTASSRKMSEKNWIKLFSLIEKIIHPFLNKDNHVDRAFLIYRLKRLYYGILLKGTLVINKRYIHRLSSECSYLEVDVRYLKMMRILNSAIYQRMVLIRRTVSRYYHWMKIY